MAKNTVESKEEMIKALEKLNEAFREVNEKWDMCDEMHDTEAISIYPFGKSFDELACDVSSWVEDTIEELQ